VSSSSAGRRARALAAVTALAAVLPGIAGCGGESPRGVPPAQAPAEDPPAAAAAREGAAQPWCEDTSWLLPAAGMYVSVYRRKHHPITASRIDKDLADDGPLGKAYRRLAGRTRPPGIPELRGFLVSVADAEDAGTDPLAYAHHIVAVCDS
jgi:predicted small lipoprotein YifL